MPQLPEAVKNLVSQFNLSDGQLGQSTETTIHVDEVA